MQQYPSFRDAVLLLKVRLTLGKPFGSGFRVVSPFTGGSMSHNLLPQAKRLEFNVRVYNILKNNGLQNGLDSPRKAPWGEIWMTDRR